MLRQREFVIGGGGKIVAGGRSRANHDFVGRREGHVAGPTALAGGRAIGPHLEVVGFLKLQTVDLARVLRGEEKLGFVIVDADLPLCGGAGLGPAQLDIVRVVGHLRSGKP